MDSDELGKPRGVKHGFIVEFEAAEFEQRGLGEQCMSMEGEVALLDLDMAMTLSER